jgi:hypothetical protein
MKILGKMGYLLWVEMGLISTGFATAAVKREAPPNLAPKGNPGMTLQAGGSLLNHTKPQPPNQNAFQKPQDVFRFKVGEVNNLFGFLVKFIPVSQGEKITKYYEQENIPIIFFDETGRCIVYRTDGSFEFYNVLRSVNSEGCKMEKLNPGIFETFGDEIKRLARKKPLKGSSALEKEEESSVEKALNEKTIVELKKYKIDKEFEAREKETLTKTFKDCFINLMNFLLRRNNTIETQPLTEQNERTQKHAPDTQPLTEQKGRTRRTAQRMPSNSGAR